MKRMFIVHGWGGYPGEGWFPWLKKELEAKGFEVFIPQMPDTANPQIHAWVSKLTEVIGTPDEDTYFVGHSMGCQTIARFLESLPSKTKVGGAVFVGGFFKRLSGLGDALDVINIADQWLNTPIDLEKIRERLNKSVAIFSDNDPFVPLENQDDFRDKLGSKIIVLHKQGHFSGPLDRMKELPVVLENILNISK